MLLTMLRDGRLHLTGIALLAPLLTRDNLDAVLARATHRSKRQIEALVAELSPRPDVPARMRKLPDIRKASLPGTSLGQDQAGRGALELVPGRVMAALELVPDRVGLPAPTSAPGAAALLRPSIASGPSASLAVPPAAPLHSLLDPPSTPPPASLRSAVVEPLSPARYKVQFTASAELRDKLERLEARRFAQTRAPRKGLGDTDVSPVSRHIPAAVRRAVRERDGDRCRYVDEQGRRCSARDRLEFHHLHPFGMGGDHSPGNVRFLCS